MLTYTFGGDGRIRCSPQLFIDFSHIQAIKQFAAAGTDFETAKQLRPHDPNFSVDYKHVNNIEYIVVRTEPDVVEPFLPVLEAVKDL